MRLTEDYVPGNGKVAMTTTYMTQLIPKQAILLKYLEKKLIFCRPAVQLWSQANEKQKEYGYVACNSDNN